MAVRKSLVVYAEGTGLTVGELRRFVLAADDIPEDTEVYVRTRVANLLSPEGVRVTTLGVVSEGKRS